MPFFCNKPFIMLYRVLVLTFVYFLLVFIMVYNEILATVCIVKNKIIASVICTYYSNNQIPYPQNAGSK